MPDFFERLGLPRRFAVDAAALEREYLTRSRAVHPDFHAAGSADDLAASTDASAALNEAYATLKDPVRRAEHLLSLYGGPSAGADRSTDAAFLAEMMDSRERVEAGGADAAAARHDLERRAADVLARIATVFDHADLDRAALGEVRRSLNALSTIRSLLRDRADD